MPDNLRWVKGANDAPADLCAHGDVVFRVSGESVLADPVARNVTVSASALYLLRTLSRSHSAEERVADHLFPCCGFVMYASPEPADVTIVGCPSGHDIEVLHAESGSSIVLRGSGGREWRVHSESWREAVFKFCDCVAEFYSACEPKRPSEEDAPGYTQFCEEWKRRRGKSLVA